MFEDLKKILEKVIPGIDLSGVTMETRLVEDLGFDSLSMMMMSMEIEDKYNFRFTEFVKFETVGAVCKYINERAKS